VNPAQYVGAPVIGALAGLYPAARAARMPTEALRTISAIGGIRRWVAAAR
jgi:hypothetical protein